MSDASISIGVCPVLDDPFFQEARSRIIWAASTCDANGKLGLKSSLICNASRTPIPYEKKPLWIANELEEFYGIDHINLLAVFNPNKYWSKSISKFLYDYSLPKTVLPHISVLHTRDPYAAKVALENGKFVILEDHDEDCQSSQRLNIVEMAKNENLKALVCITPHLMETYKQLGVDIRKLIVADSGVNVIVDSDLGESSTEIERNRLTIGYAGGLQKERDIDVLMAAATAMNNTQFIFVGGREGLVDELTRKAIEAGANNIDFLGYMKFNDMRKIMLERCDGFIYSRSAGKHELNSSPLKLFDYFNYRKPIICAINENTREYLSYKGIFGYTPGSVKSMISAAENLENFVNGKNRVSPELRILAEGKSWLNRQKKILQFAGVL